MLQSVYMHAGVFYGILTAGLYFIGEAVSSLRRYVPKLSFSPLRLKLYFVTGLGITLGLLINPYGYKVFGVALAHSADMGTSPSQRPLLGNFLISAFIANLRSRRITPLHILNTKIFGPPPLRKTPFC